MDLLKGVTTCTARTSALRRSLLSLVLSEPAKIHSCSMAVQGPAAPAARSSAVAAANKVYAIRSGRKTGIFRNWDDVLDNINGFPGAEHRSFSTTAEAKAWLHGHSHKQAPVAKRVQQVDVPEEEARLQNEFVSKGPRLSLLRQQRNSDTTAPGKVYAIKHGRETGLFTSWSEVSGHVTGFPGAKHKAFESVLEAQEWLAGPEHGPPTAKESRQTTTTSKLIKNQSLLPPALEHTQLQQQHERVTLVTKSCSTADADASQGGSGRSGSVVDGVTSTIDVDCSASKSMAVTDVATVSADTADAGTVSPRSLTATGTAQNNSRAKASWKPSPNSAAQRMRQARQGLPKPEGEQVGQEEVVLPQQPLRPVVRWLGPVNVALVHKVGFDGGSRGNPGNAGCGAVLIQEASGVKVAEVVCPLGIATNNVAEYQGLITGLRVGALSDLAHMTACLLLTTLTSDTPYQAALDVGICKVAVVGDSDLVVRQVKGEWRCRHTGLQTLHEQVQQLRAQFTSFSIHHVYRKDNELADALSNEAMDMGVK